MVNEQGRPPGPLDVAEARERGRRLRLVVDGADDASVVEREADRDESWVTRRSRGAEATDAGLGEAGEGPGVLIGYFASQPLRVCFCSACFWCFAARFSLSDRPGFFPSAAGFDFDAMGAA